MLSGLRGLQSELKLICFLSSCQLSLDLWPLCFFQAVFPVQAEQRGLVTTLASILLLSVLLGWWAWLEGHLLFLLLLLLLKKLQFCFSTQIFHHQAGRARRQHEGL